MEKSDKNRVATVHPEVVGKVGRARQIGRRAAARRHPLTSKKTKLLFWLFMVIFGYFSFKYSP
jgi:hypothetical protein